MARSLTIVVLALVAACAGAPAKTVEPPRATPLSSLQEPAPILVKLSSDREAEDRLHVDLELPSAGRTFAYKPVHAATIGDLTAKDARGPIAVERVTDRYELARGPEGRLALHYSVKLSPPVELGSARESTIDLPWNDGLFPYAEPLELRALGSDVLLLPANASAEPTKIDVQVHTVGKEANGATSYAIGRDQTITASLLDLRDTLFLGGDLGTASFHSVDGNDFAAWLGMTSFDPRWVSAELAGVRASVDRWMGRAIRPDAPATSILFAVNRSSEPPVIVRAAPHGFIVAVDRYAPWSPTALLLSTQALTQRYVGGFVRVEAGDFFATGFSRAIARDILVDLGLFGPEQRATEMNALLATLVFGSDVRALATARGALAATSLDTALRSRSKGEKSLKTFIREILAEAANERRSTITRFAFLSKIAQATDQTTADYFDAVVDRGAEVDIAVDLLAPCHRLEAKDLVAFELGFASSPTTAAGERKVDSVKKFSRAEAAGLRAGDVIADLKYERGKSAVPVELTTTRDGKKVRLKFLPAGAAKPGRVFERLPNAPAERCRG